MNRKDLEEINLNDDKRGNFLLSRAEKGWVVNRGEKEIWGKFNIQRPVEV
jgi:hypothetical protein